MLTEISDKKSFSISANGRAVGGQGINHSRSNNSYDSYQDKIRKSTFESIYSNSQNSYASQIIRENSLSQFKLGNVTPTGGAPNQNRFTNSTI